MRTAPTSSELLAAWERAEGVRAARAAVALLSATTPAADAAALPIGRRDAALLDLREAVFGSAFTGVTSCPACGEEIELSFDAAEVRRMPPDERTLRVDDLELRLPDSRDLAAVERAPDLASARALLLARCVVSDIDVAALSQETSDAIAMALAAADPQADVQLDVDCPSCAHGWREPFDVTTFLSAELSVWARRLLADIHTIASGYGWSEAEILALSPVRRDAYLELLR